MITWTNVSNLDSRLAAVETASQLSILNYVSQVLAPDAFGEKYDLALMLFAAHLGALELRGGGVGFTTGLVTSESLGPASRSYAQPPSTLASTYGFDNTIWGQQLSFLMRSYPWIMVT